MIKKDELSRVSKEPLLICVVVLSCQLRGRTEESRAKCKSKYWSWTWNRIQALSIFRPLNLKIYSSDI